MINNINLYSGKFIPGNLNQWKLYKKDNSLIWLADDNLDQKYNYLAKNISSDQNINKIILKKILQNIFVDKLPGKYNYNIGEKGQKLSGGQKQRLVLARAFLSKAKILILDEATSSLGHALEKHVKKAIKEFVKINNSTIIIIAHRHTTIENADFVIYLEDGKVRDTGSPEKIFSKYAEI
jgi:ATP-binding cassette subfamily B protein